MELSVDVHNLLEQFRVLKKRSEEFACSEQVSLNSSYEITLDSIIDVDKISFSNDETWLYETSRFDGLTGKHLHTWLHQDIESDKYKKGQNFTDELNQEHVRSEEKVFDSRTFTRPKKRFSRPSIEKYNEQLYGNNEFDAMVPNSPKQTDREPSSPRIEEDKIVPISNKPLPFDLSQPSSSYYFENIAANAAEADCFQNMSPPSLVNSMCSSTFTNLMENSFIKNDPVLREICDTDFTETVLLQDSEPPVFQSFSESYSSLNSDSAENFLRRLSITSSFRKSLLKEFEDVDPMTANETFNVDDDIKESVTKDDLNSTFDAHIDNKSQNTENLSKGHSSPNMNGTYKRPAKYATYRKPSNKKGSSPLDSTFQVSSTGSTPTESFTESSKSDSPNDVQSFSSTITAESPKLKRRFEKSQAQRREQLELVKQQQQLNCDQTFCTEPNLVTDLNRLNYLNEHNKINYSHNEDSNISSNKRQSLECSTGSADSLDRMSSSLSNSSRGSNRLLNMAEVDAIVQMQEQSLQIMSTPKPNMPTKKLWENNGISPIVVNGSYSDSDQSSNDDFKSARSNLSKVSTNEGSLKSAKSLSYIPSKGDMKKPLQKSVNPTGSTRNLQSMANSIRGSYTNLQGSNLGKTSTSIRGSQSNLKSVGNTLRGSYTSLRPISCVDLPVAPPITKTISNTTVSSKVHRISSNPNTTRVVASSTKIAQVAPIPRESQVGDSHFVKPLPPRASGLPRPVGTGIPRATTRIPGPRTFRAPNNRQGKSSGEGY